MMEICLACCIVDNEWFWDTEARKAQNTFPHRYICLHVHVLTHLFCVQSNSDSSPSPFLWRSGFGKTSFPSLQQSSDVEAFCSLFTGLITTGKVSFFFSNTRQGQCDTCCAWFTIPRTRIRTTSRILSWRSCARRHLSSDTCLEWHTETKRQTITIKKAK